MIGRNHSFAVLRILALITTLSLRTGGIQNQPYSFFRDGVLTTNVSEATYNTTFGKPIIEKEGEVDSEWDSTKYSQVLVNEK